MNGEPVARTVTARPSKHFFVSMLTRDISLEDCIFDLVDNSIDGAWSMAGDRPRTLEAGDALAAYRVEIDLGADHFRISDNCGGISLESAADYAFTFGRETEDVSHAFQVGVYGIGMKRAIFKMGRKISIQSTHHRTDGGIDSYVVPIDVREWTADPEGSWDFSLEDVAPLGAPGVEIRISELLDDAKRRFADPTFADRLRRGIARDYVAALMQGVTITVNGQEVAYRPIEFLLGDGFAPMRDGYEDGEVHVEIVAGMVARPSDDLTPDGQNREDVSGWHVICNGRVVLFADRTEATGWGVQAVPRWHPQFAGFAGVVLFSSANPLNLPMTTTKRSVDQGAGVYQRALQRMADPTRAWVGYTNARKNNVEEAHKRESEVRTILLADVEAQPLVVLPVPPSTKGRRMANVNYAVPLERMRKLADGLGDRRKSYRDVGLESFDFTYSKLVSDDE